MGLSENRVLDQHTNQTPSLVYHHFPHCQVAEFSSGPQAIVISQPATAQQKQPNKNSAKFHHQATTLLNRLFKTAKRKSACANTHGISSRAGSGHLEKYVLIRKKIFCQSQIVSSSSSPPAEIIIIIISFSIRWSLEYGPYGENI